MATTAAGIVNAALDLIGDQVQISGTPPAFDGSPAGAAAGVVYAPAVALLLRQLLPEFARRTAPLIAAGSADISWPWSAAYDYPVDCVRLLQVAPAASVVDPNNPLPVRWQVGADNAAPTTKLIFAGVASAQAVYISSSVTEAQFDALFVEALSRRLANPLAMAIAGRPDFARELLAEAEHYAALSEASDEAMIR